MHRCMQCCPQACSSLHLPQGRPTAACHSWVTSACLFALPMPIIVMGYVTAALLCYAVTRPLSTQLSGFLHVKQLFTPRLLDVGYPAHQLQSCYDSVNTINVQHTCRQHILSQAPQNRQWRSQPPGWPVLVLTHVYAQYSPHAEIADVFDSTEAKISVAYTKPVPLEQSW